METSKKLALPKFSLAAQKIWVAQNLGGLQPPSPPPDPYAYEHDLLSFSFAVDDKDEIFLPVLDST